MNLPDIVDRETWHARRLELLDAEKALTRQRDALSHQRHRLPMVPVTSDYVFEDASGPVRLIDLFSGRRQLIVQHFMFAPGTAEVCRSCTAAADEVSAGLLAHLASRETAFVLVSRAPFAELDRYRVERGWSLRWVSSFESDFNYDFGVSIDPARGPVEFNYRSGQALADAGLGWLEDGPTEQPGYSCFLRVNDDVFHTYSTFARGTEWTGGSYAFLDMTALGRQEDWEQPAGRADTAHAAVPNFDPPESS